MHKTAEVTKLIHENFWIVISFALARPKARQLLDTNFKGSWKPLNKIIEERAEIRADRALLEMATQIRVLDDAEGLSHYLKEVGQHSFGHVEQVDGIHTELHLRDMTNKVMHASGFVWPEEDELSVICISNDLDRWRYAKISLLALMSFCGQLAA